MYPPARERAPGPRRGRWGDDTCRTRGLLSNMQGKGQYHLGTAQKQRRPPYDLAVQHVGKFTNDVAAKTDAICGATWPHAIICNDQCSLLASWIARKRDP